MQRLNDIYDVIKLINIVCLFFFPYSTLTISSQSTSEEYFLNESTKIWEIYNQEVAKINELLVKYPEKQDSLKEAADKLLAHSIVETQQIGERYASLASGLEQLYKARLNLTKDTLCTILNMASSKLKVSPYGKSIRAHINTHQIETGDKYADFTAIDSDGNNFVLSSLEGKKMLLLYCDAGCMEEEIKKDLSVLCKEALRTGFKIVVFSPHADSKQLVELKRCFDSDYIFVSDFLGDHSPIKIKYGLQPVPALVFIDSNGIVLLKSTEMPAKSLKTLAGSIAGLKTKNLQKY